MLEMLWNIFVMLLYAEYDSCCYDFDISMTYVTEYNAVFLQRVRKKTTNGCSKLNSRQKYSV